MAWVSMYQWFSSHFRYTGIAKLSRRSCSQEGGPAMRLLEHLYNTVRPNAKEGKKLRYRNVDLWFINGPRIMSLFFLRRFIKAPRIMSFFWEG